MKVIYLGHSGFLVETERAVYLFDHIRGELPEFPQGKPLFVFVSHAHGDHFDRRIFEGRIGAAAEHYILGYDIRKKLKREQSASWLGQQAKVSWAEPGVEMAFPECRVLPLRSTDCGVAFALQETGGPAIYHAGDLGWWHWEEESYGWNRNMEVNFKREMGRLKDWHFQAAFVPLDPRQEDAYWYGLDYFLKHVEAEHVFPMHFWEDYALIPRFIREHGGGDRIRSIDREGQVFELTP